MQLLVTNSNVPLNSSYEIKSKPPHRRTEGNGLDGKWLNDVCTFQFVVGQGMLHRILYDEARCESTANLI